VRVLSQRILNRTLLDRQFLLSRTRLTALEVVRRLVAVQAQEPNWPYVGLWTRIDGFAHDDLTALLTDRQVVRAGLLRSTQHLVAGDDFGWLRPLVQPVLDRTLRTAYFTSQVGGLDLDAVADAGREALKGRVMARRELGKLLAQRFPGRSGAILAAVVQLRVPLVHPPPNGTWGGWGNRPVTPVTLAGPVAAAPDPAHLVERYLAAFGPASVMDVQAWSGLTRLGEVVDGMRLRSYRGEDGRELFDLPDAGLADPDTPAPVRLLPAYDNLLLGHADRTRVLDRAVMPAVLPGRAQVLPTVLVDGTVAATWSLDGGAPAVHPARTLTPAERDLVEAEAARLGDFIHRDSSPT